MTNKEKYKKAFNVLASSEPISLEVNAMKNKKRKLSGNIAAAVAICVLLAGGGTGVYAAAKYLGVKDFADRSGMKLPETATEEIQKDIDVTQSENNTIFESSVKEALCDSESIMLVYEVHAKEANQYLFVPEDALPTDSVQDIGYAEDKSIGDYAAEKNLTIVYIGGGISNRDELGIAEASMDFVSAGDDVMDVFVHCGVTETAQTRDVNVVATGRIDGQEDVMSLESTFQLQDMSTTTTTEYACGENMSQGDFYEIQKAQVVQTDIGTYVDIYYRNDRLGNPDDGLTFSVVDRDGNELQSMGGSGEEVVDNDDCKIRCMLEKCEIGETLYIKAFDCNEKNVYGIFELHMVEE